MQSGPDSFHISGSHAAAEETMEHSLFSPPLSLFLPETSEREFLLPAAVNSCVVSDRRARAAVVGDPQIHCNEWRTDRPAAAAGKYLCLHYLNKRSGGSDREDDDGGGGGEEEE